MSFKLGDVIIDRLQFGYGASKKNGSPLYALTQLNQATIDITADFKASSCFGSYDDTLIDCNLFNNINELERYFQYKMFKKTELNYSGKCKNCEKFNLQQCQGGCLSFSK